MIWSWTRILLFMGLVLGSLAAAYLIVEQRSRLAFEAEVSDLASRFLKAKEGMNKQQVLDLLDTPPASTGTSRSEAHTWEFLFWSVPRRDGKAPPTVIVTMKDGTVERLEKR